MKYKKTDLGQQAFKEQSRNLTARQRSAFIMIDGKKDVSELYTMLAAVGVTSEDINNLMDLGYIEEVAGSDSVRTTANPVIASNATPNLATTKEPVSELAQQERYQKAYPVACKLTSGMGLRGFRLNMAVEGAGSYRDLLEIAPKIRDAVGDEKYAELHKALKGL